MASMSVPCPKISAASRVGSVVAGSSRQQPKPKKISFPQAQNWGFSASQSLNKNKSAVWKRYSQLGQVSTGNSAVDAKAEPEPLNGKVEAVESDGLDAPTLSAFMAQVSDLVKLVDSRDIVELELKQLDCELIIRKKEALQQQAAAAAPFMQMPQPPMHFQQFQPAAPPASAAPVAPSAPAAPAKTSQPSPSPSSSHPPFKCPMAGTFYRSPAPGEPPFVKVGDKVQKGQVVCIIEAMKLMNEIEADQSGTVVEIVAEDGKPVSVDSPLFIIVP